MYYNYILQKQTSLFVYNSRQLQNYMGDSFCFKPYLSYYNFNQISKNISSLNQESLTQESDLFPLAVRYVSPNKDLFVVERPPFALNNVDFSTTKSYTQRKIPKILSSQSIWIPWTVSVIRVNPSSSYTFSLFFNDGPLQSLDDFIIPAFLPNVGTGGQVCMGQDALAGNQILSNTSSSIKLFQHLFNSYFSGWNSDILPSIPYLNYFFDNGRVDQVSKLKGSPKNFSEILSHYSWPTSRVYKFFFYLWSNLDVQEVINYISYIKQRFTIDKSQYVDGYKISSFVSSKTKHLSSTLNNMNYFTSNINEMIPVHSEYTAAPTVLINNSPRTETSMSYISNPYIIAKLYNSFMDIIDFSSDDSCVSMPQIEFEHAEVAPYIRSISKQDLNAVSS